MDPKAKMEQIKKLFESMKALEVSLNAEKQEVQNLLTQGRNPEAEALKQKMVPRIMILQKLKQVALNTQRAQAANAQNPQMAGQLPPPGSAGQAQAPGQMAGPSNPTNAQALHLQQLSLLQQARTQTAQLNANTNTNASASSSFNLPPNMQLNPNVAAQMQKLQMREGIQGVQSQLHQQAQLQQPPFGGTSQPSATPTSSWMGTFSFKLPHPTEVHVMMSSIGPTM